MATTFYPFVENNGCSDDANIAQPSTSARIAVYDDMSMPPRVVLVEPSDITSYLSNITQTVYELVSQKCDEWPFMVIRELVENYIHALFIEPSISILDKGRTIVFSDQGPGIANKEASRGVGFSSATPAMKKYIRGVGSGFPIVEAHMKTHGGTIRIEDNLGRGTIVTVSLGMGEPEKPASQAPAAQQPAQQPYVQPQANGYAQNSGAYRMQGFEQGGYGYQQPAYGYPQQMPPTGYQQPYGSHQGYQQPYGNPQGWQPQMPYGAVPPQYGQQMPPNPYGGQPQPYGMPYGAQSAGMGYGAEYAQPSGQAQPQPQQAWAAPSVPQPMGAQAAGIDAHVPMSSEERDILKVFRQVEKVGPTELNRRLGIPAATGSRKLSDLARAGYITKNGQKYILTGEGERVLTYLMKGEV